ncbi:hypothetical protein C1H46_033433 [Malus baccata]|uniref:Uncharacterized protein n=1 Tax=Malus baccata TaxID=106549 RepID=A0A540L3H4_MALBA|nr:hypothetical protein C1H46_033433 [Malus baccata]
MKLIKFSYKSLQQEQVESVDPDHDHAMDETVADTDLKGQVNVAVDEKVHVVENEQVVIKNEQVEDLAEKVDVMDDDHQQGRRVDANRVSSDEQVIEVVDAEKVDMMDDNDQATHEQPIVSENQENSTKSDGSNDDEQDPATMLPRDQLPVVEALQTHVKSEVGGVAEKVDNDDQATQEQPIGFYYEKQENLTKTDESNDDDEQDIATILRHDQQAQEIQSQGLTPSQAAPAVNGSFYSPGTNFSQMNPFDNIPVVPQQGMPANFLNRNNAYQPVAGELPRATPRPRISMSNWQENVNIPAQNLLANNNWLPQGQSSQGLQNYSNNASASSSRAIKNALYDPKYEAMGLPIDPHLRLFLAQQRRENDR